METTRNCYEILNVRPDASIDEIKASFRKLALIHHPDKNNNSRESQIIFKIIYNAYETLKTEKNRREYDTYLKASSIIKHTSNNMNKKPAFPKKVVNAAWSVKNICTQCHFILWEIEDILRAAQKIPANTIYGGRTIHQWVLKILLFFDTWVLEPAGCIDYFYEARNIKNRRVSDMFKRGFDSAGHRPYANIYDYFYEIRKRMEKFLNKVRINDLLKHNDTTTLIDNIFEAFRLSYHYLGSLQLIIKNKSTTIAPFIYSNKHYDDGAKELIDD
jgi:curved DNA-binding protein CbpA